MGSFTRCFVGAAVLVLSFGTGSVVASGIEPSTLNVPMRDGVGLSTDVWMPTELGPHPTILVRTPYGKGRFFGSAARVFADHGYAFVIQDVRGRGASEGVFDFFFPDGRDGYDTIEWIARQAWSDGRVGMLGLSYLATVQWLAARERSSHLVCIAPMSPAGRYFDELPYQGGAYVVGPMLPTLYGMTGTEVNDPSKVDWEHVYRHRPLMTMDEAIGVSIPLHRQMLEHPTLDAYWKRIQFEAHDFEQIAIPALHIAGWFDADQAGAVFYWEGMRAHSSARDHQYLIIGPWRHAQTGSASVGEWTFTDDAEINSIGLQLQFFDRFLKMEETSFDLPRARIYLTGVNQWLDLQDYPPTADPQRLYLRSGGNANTLNGDGFLSWQPPSDEPPDLFTYDPAEPVLQDLQTQNLGADQRELEKRSDVLVYTSRPLESQLQVVGPVVVELYASSDARDTDFTGNILDVHPDGRAVKLGPRPAGIIRARYRNGYEQTDLLTPGKPELFEIELFDIGHVFQRGHRIRVEISSSSYPYFHPNPNTGNPIATDTTFVVARQRVYHDRARASCLVLPVAKRPTDGGE